MTNQWGYIDPVERVHQQRAQQAMWQPPIQAPAWNPPIQPVIESPLQLGNIPQILAQATPRRRNVAVDAAVGAAFGAMVGRMFSKRRARKAQQMRDIKQRLGVRDDYYDN